MDEHLEPGTQILDDQLAEITDQLLDGKTLEELSIPIQDQELRGYQETVALMKREVENMQPGEHLVERVRYNLIKEWQQSGIQRSQSVWKSWFNKIRVKPPVWQSAGKRQRTYALRLALTAVFVLVLAFFIFPTLNIALPGSAGSSADLVLLVFIFITLLGFILWWLASRKS
jgi:hypothetical protein